MRFGDSAAGSSLQRMWDSLAPIGRDERTGGYWRFSLTDTDKTLRAWFAAEAARRGLDLEQDGNGNLFAWWGGRGPDAVLTGSHLDSVAGGGGFDGPLGVVSGLAAIDLLRQRGLRPSRPVGVAVFAEEEGGRFGAACLGSRLLTGQTSAPDARARQDNDGVTFAGAMAAAGYDPDAIGADPGLVERIGVFVELHVEQGRALATMDTAIALAEGIWPHGRWLFEFTGRADHAGTTRLADRNDPMVPFATAVLAAREAAERHGSLCTFGKILASPGAPNAIASMLRAWLDARAPDETRLASLTGDIESAARSAAAEHHVGLDVRRESFSPAVGFDPALRDRLASALAAGGIKTVTLPTGAGHDAGILSAHVPTAMLFVRNPTGVSHAPSEGADPADCVAGVEALAAVLEELAS